MTSLPQSRRPEEAYAYSLEEVLTMIDALPETAATMVAAAAYTGARRGELRGAFWENYRDGELLIALSLEWNYNRAQEPESKAPIPIIGKLASRLTLHRQRQGNPISGATFPNEAGKPSDPNNLFAARDSARSQRLRHLQQIRG